MMGLLQAEWLRFIRNPVNLWVIAAFFTLLAASALWSGLAASEVSCQSIAAATPNR
jgi:hypothetical protein